MLRLKVLLFFATSLIFISSRNCLFIVNAIYSQKNDTILINAKYIRRCQGYENKNPWNLYTSLQKYNRTVSTLSLNITLQETFDDTFNLEVQSYFWGDGGWKRAFQWDQSNACTAMHLLAGKVWKDLLIAANASLTCPVKAGFYTINNSSFEFMLPIFYTPRRYHIKGIIKKDDQIKFCIEGEGDVKLQFKW